MYSGSTVQAVCLADLLAHLDKFRYIYFVFDKPNQAA